MKDASAITGPLTAVVEPSTAALRRWLVASTALLPVAIAMLPVADAYAQQVEAGSGETKNIDNQTISTSADSTSALYAHDGGTIEGENATVSTTGGGSHAASAESGGTIDLTGGSLTTNGFGSFGISAGGPGSQVTTNGTDITGNNAHGVQAFDGGTVSITGGTLTTEGSGADGLVAQDADTTITAQDLDIVVNSDGGVGAFALDDSAIDLTGGTIALNVDGYGLAAEGTVTANGTVITATPDDAIGVWSQGDGSQIDLTDVSLTTQGTGGHGLQVSSDGGITMTGGTLDVQGAGANAVLSQADAGSTNTVSFDNVDITVAQDTAFAAQGGTTDITVSDGTTLDATANGLMTVSHHNDTSNFGTATLTVDASTISGDITVDGAAANVASVVLQNGASLTGDITADDTNGGYADLSVQGSTYQGTLQNARNVSLLSGGTWTLTGDSNVTGTFTNAGTLSFQQDGTFRTLTMTGSYVGNGGTVVMNTVLGGDGSPTDRLVFDGASASAAGTTQIAIQNAGGAGAATDQGIMVVETLNGATTGSSAFTLANPVVQGVYQYQLQRGLDGGTADEQQSWYLRNGVVSGNPSYRPEAAIFGAMPSLARAMTRTTIGTFHERNGDQGLAGAGGQGHFPGSWGRVFGQHTTQGHDSEVDPTFKGHLGGFQLGVDVYASRDRTGHSDRVGVLGGYAVADGKVRGYVLGSDDTFAGKPKLEAWTLGGYWTHIGPGGWYVDTVLMGTSFHGSGRSTNDIDADVDAFGFSASIEAGYPIALTDALVLEPQAQFLYQHLQFDDADDGLSTVSYKTPDSAAGRIGLRLSGDLAGGDTLFRPYVKANLWRDFAGTDKTIFDASDEIGVRHEVTAVEVGGGVVARISRAVGVWVVADYTTDVSGSADRETVKGNLGLRVAW